MKDVRERSELFHAHTEPFIDQLRRVSTIHDDVVVVDLRDEDTIFAGNRFMVYALYPEARVSIHALWGKNKQNTVFAAGSPSWTALAGGHRLDHAGVRRRRPPRGRHLPGRQRRRRTGARRAHPGTGAAPRPGLIPAAVAADSTVAIGMIVTSTLTSATSPSRISATAIRCPPPPEPPPASHRAVTPRGVISPTAGEICWRRYPLLTVSSLAVGESAFVTV